MPTDPRSIESYNQHARNYHDHVSNPSVSLFHSYYEKPALRAELPDLHGLGVLCIGCGSGVDAQWLLDNGAKSVTGIDIASVLIEIGKKEHPKIDLKVMDMEKLDFEDESFDLVCSSLAIHYVDDMTQSLTEAHRVLKKGGLYVFSCGHPLDTALDLSADDKTRSARLGLIVNKDTDERTIYGDYLALEGNGTKNVDGDLGDLQVRIYHRTFSVMLEQIKASGFNLEKVVEPLPTKEMQNADPGVYEQLNRLPTFIIWVLRK